MPWITPRYSKSQVDKAGEILRNTKGIIPTNEKSPILEIIGNYRSSHGYALNNYQNIMRTMAAKLGGHYLLAQRLKRMPSILNKLIDRHGMRLTQIQDIGGCRLVLEDMKSVNNFTERIRNGKLSKKIIESLSDNYVINPKKDGYRCVHLVFKYQKNKGTSPFNGQKIEIQIRTKIQHAWATALESVDLFKRYKLKSGKGPTEWHNFFAACSSAFSTMEKSPLVPEYDWEKQRLRTFIQERVDSLDVYNTLKKYKSIVESIDKLPIEKGEKKYGYVLVVLNLSINKLSMIGYRRNQFDQANDAYLKAEEQAIHNHNDEVALVATERIDELRKAYPNYYMDTDYFMTKLKYFIDSN